MRGPHDIMFAVHPPAFDTYAAVVTEGGWDEPVLATCVAALRSGDVFYDIGANIGYITLSAAKHFAGGVRVYGFEPQPDLARNVAISANLSGLSDVTVFSCMLGDTEGEADLFMTAHSIHVSGVSREADAPRISRPMHCIDRLIEAGVAPVPRVMKIDVEGAELHVLRGAAALLKDHPPYLVLESDVNAERFGYTRRDLIAFVRGQADYRFFAIQPAPIGLSELGDDDLDSEAVRDILAVPPGAPVPDPR